ncbi:MAG TPA: hypothetical protein VL358_14930 [Caulobacteraceae bacterium]|nr:hypothetical protein [Caulobacteraceae bacterium]
MIRPAAAWTLALALGAAAPAWAQVDLLSHETLSGLVDLRLAAADGERSWTDGGYGKGRFSGARDGFRITPQVAEAAVVWKPRFTWDLGAVVQLDAQAGQTHFIDVTEAYLAYKPAPRSDWRYSARAGLFYPPISLEHTDPAWGVAHTITPSAINSWVGEEVKVLGFEQKLTRTIGDQEFSATVAGFGYNDTSGTLLSLRGWALDDIKTTAFGELPLPRLEPEYQGIWRAQAPYTIPTLNLTGRVGYYGRLDWRTAGPVAFNLFYYNNAGNRTAVVNDQWSWETKFWNLGASWDVDPHTLILAQAITGRTLEGYPTPQGIWIDVTFSSAYVLATHSFGATSLTGRIDWFDTVDQTYVQRDNNNEWGWAYTAALRRDLTPKVAVLVEVVHVDSARYAREYVGVDDDKQTQTTVQSSLRLRF